MVFSRLAKEFKKSQAEIAESFNLKQQQVSEYIRLLELPKEIQDLTARAVISVRHARELLKISDSEKMKELAIEVKEKSLSTRELSKKLKESKVGPNREHLKVETSDIVFESDEVGKNSNEISSDKLEISDISENIPKSLPDNGLDEIKLALSAHVAQENRRSWLERVHFRLIPGRYYQKMEYWLSFDLGSTLRPEAWLIRLEIATLVGLGLLLLTFSLPAWIVAAALAFFGGLLTFLFII